MPISRGQTNNSLKNIPNTPHELYNMTCNAR